MIYILQHVITVYASCAIIVHNVSVMILYKRKSEKVIQTRPLFTIAIIIADTLFSVFSVLGNTVYFVGNYDRNLVLLYIVVGIKSISIGPLLVSQWCQLAFVFDRLFAIRYPIQYYIWFTKKRRACIVAIICVTGLVIAATITGLMVTMIVMLGPTPNETHFSMTQSILHVSERIFTISCLLIAFPGPLSLALFIYTTVLVYQARAHTRHLQGLPDLSWTSRILAEKSNVLLAAAMSVSTTLGFPLYYALLFYNDVTTYLLSPYSDYFNIVEIIAYIGLLISPWVYAYNKTKMFQFIFVFKSNTRTIESHKSKVGEEKLNREMEEI